MKKILKISLWAIGTIVGLVIIGAVVFLINFLIATKAMSPSETGPINDTVWCIKDRFVNSYIFKGDNEYLLIDAGLSADNFKVELEKTGISADQITTLLLTHTDGDHIGAAGLFANAAIYMHRDEEQMINGTTGKTKFAKTLWKFGPYKLLDSDDTLTIDGLKIRILHTPGHTPGSSCYVIGSDYLVTGDNLKVSGKVYENFIEKFNMDTPRQVESLKSLPAPSEFKYVLTSHDGFIKNNE